MKLKDIRTNAGLTQNQLADIIKVHTPEISNAENEVSYLQLEDIVILQNHFNTKIDLKENLTPLRKHQVTQSIIELCQKFPIPVVAEFLGRVYRREASADSIIMTYGQIAGASFEEPLYPA